MDIFCTVEPLLGSVPGGIQLKGYLRSAVRAVMLYVNSFSLLFYSPNDILRFSKEASRSKILKKKKKKKGEGGVKYFFFFKSFIFTF